MSNAEKRGPARYGQIKLGAGMKPVHARKHLKMMETTSNLTKDYGAHCGAGQASQGGFTGSGMSDGASGGDYSTNNAGNTGDCDSAGATGY